MVRPLPNLLVDCRRQMISPIAVQTAFDLEFDLFGTQSFGYLHLSHFELAGGLFFGLAHNCPVVNPRFINDGSRTAKGIIWNPPLLLETFHCRSIHHKPNRDHVSDGYLSRVGAMQNSRRQFSRLLADLVKISTVIEQGPAIRFTWSDTEHRN